MPGKIVIAETNKLRVTGEIEAFAAFRQIEVMRLDCTQNFNALQAFLASNDPETRVLLVSSEMRGDAGLSKLLASSKLASSSVWVEVGGDGIAEKGVLSSVSPMDLAAPAMITLLYSAFDPDRPAGVKSFLKEGAIIYTHSFTSPTGVGTALDPCIGFAKEKLTLAKTMSFWGALNALVAEALVMLPNKAAEGARVEVQLGVDEQNVCASVRFPYTYTEAKQLKARVVYQPNSGASPWLIARETANFAEIRAYAENQSVEFTIAFAREDFPQSAFRPVVVREIAVIPLEKPESVARYRFQPFSAIAAGKKAKAGFRKSFSERIEETKTVVKGAAPEPELKTIVKGAAPVPEQKTVVKETAAPAPEKLTLVKGTAYGEDPPMAEIRAQNDPEKKASLYESKILSLQATIAQREELVTKLNKEIAEINDPLRRGVVSGVIDQQKEALIQKLKKFEEAAKAAEAREKELISMVDKAIQQKDKVAKDAKALEAKLGQASSGNNSLVVKLQKQLEESNRRNSVLSQKITEIAGKKAS